MCLNILGPGYYFVQGRSSVFPQLAILAPKCLSVAENIRKPVLICPRNVYRFCSVQKFSRSRVLLLCINDRNPILFHNSNFWNQVLFSNFRSTVLLHIWNFENLSIGLYLNFPKPEYCLSTWMSCIASFPKAFQNPIIVLCLSWLELQLSEF